MTKRDFFTLLLAFCLLPPLSAQVNRDSLRRIWENEALHDTVRLQALHNWTWDLRPEDPDSFSILADLQIEYSKDRGLKSWEAKALNSKGVAHYLTGEFPQAYTYFKKSLELFEALEDLKKMAALYNNIGLIFREHGDYINALDNIQKGLAINESRKDTAAIAGDYINIGLIYHDQHDYDKALEYYEKSLVLREAKGLQMALLYSNMGAVYAERDNPDFEKALEYYHKSLALREEAGDKAGIAVSLQNLGHAYTKQGEYDRATRYLQQSITLYDEVMDKNGLAAVYYGMGDIYALRGDHGQSIEWCRKSLDLSIEIEAMPFERRACYCLYEGYKALAQHGKALEYHERFKRLTDSLQREELEVRLNQMEFGRKILADSLAREEALLKNELAHQTALRKKSHTSTFILIAALVLLVFALGFLSRMFYFRKKSEKFQHKAQLLEKQQLISEISLLKTQINPHFLFNSLSILSSLVHFDADLSERFIQQLSKSYRYILEHRDQSIVTLRTELEFIEAYAFLLKIRFEHKFDLAFDLPEESLDRFRIAPLTLQLLVENAVKHNRMSVKSPLVVQVDLEGDMLRVRNKMQARSAISPSTRLGLENIRSSYSLLAERPVEAGIEGEEWVVRIPLL